MKAVLVLTLSVAAMSLPAVAQTPAMTVPLANQQLAGTVESVTVVDGEQRVVLKDDAGFEDDVTISNDAETIPAGSPLAAGVRVVLTGYNAGSYFDATAVRIVAAGRSDIPVAQAPRYVAPPPPPPPVPNALPSYAYPGPAYGAAYGPASVYAPAAVVLVYPVIGYRISGGVRFPIYSARAYRVYPRSARAYRYRR